MKKLISALLLVQVLTCDTDCLDSCCENTLGENCEQYCDCDDILGSECKENPTKSVNRLLYGNALGSIKTSAKKPQILKIA